MNINAFSIIIITALSLKFILDSAVNYLTLRSMCRELPGKLASIYDRDTYRRSQEYARARKKLEIAGDITGLLVLFAFWFAGGFAYVDSLIRSWGLVPIVSDLLYIGIVFLAYELLMLPFVIYSTFVIEQRYGFNRTTAGLFIKDTVKGLILMAVIGIPVIAGVLSIFEYFGSLAWLYCWIALILFSIIMHFIAPLWIMPWFLKFKPVTSNELRNAILDYAATVSYKISDVYIVDASRRSTKSNAFFTGFGRSKRIAIFDTLVEKYSIAEIVAILAHEIGHYKQKHIVWGIVASIVQSGIMLFLLSLFLNSAGLYYAFGVEPAVYLGILFFAMLFAPLNFILSIVLNKISRRNEYAADKFAIMTIPEPASFVSTLKKLASANLINITPHPLDVLLNYSHPPLMDRIQALELSMMKRAAS